MRVPAAHKSLVPNLPQATDVASLVHDQASNAWAQLQTVAGSPLFPAIQGYCLQTNASASFTVAAVGLVAFPSYQPL